jgi:hypothetical protein
LPANYFYWKEKPADTILALNKVLKVMLRQMIFHVDYYSAMVDDQRLPLVYSNDGCTQTKLVIS